jgi:hypothetical protein
LFAFIKEGNAKLKEQRNKNEKNWKDIFRGSSESLGTLPALFEGRLSFFHWETWHYWLYYREKKIWVVSVLLHDSSLLKKSLIFLPFNKNEFSYYNWSLNVIKKIKLSWV